MALVRIFIKGIAMNYHKDDGLWRILFPIGDCHEIKFMKNDTDPGLALAKGNRQIRIRTEGASSKFQTGDNFDQFLDLTAEYSHKDGVKVRDGWAEKAVLMTVENAKFSVDTLTNIDHFMLQGNKVTRSPGRIGYDGVLEIEADKVTVEVDDHAKFPQSFTEDTILIFDNDCGLFDPRKLSDFDMVYNVVDDANNPGQKFEMAKITDQMKGSLAAGTVLDHEDFQKVKDSLSKGLPCHEIQISRANGLP
jgi:hypothetical protein